MLSLLLFENQISCNGGGEIWIKAAEQSTEIPPTQLNNSINEYKLSLLKICLFSKLKVGKHKGDKVIGCKYMNAELNAY